MARGWSPCGLYEVASWKSMTYQFTAEPNSGGGGGTLGETADEVLRRPRGFDRDGFESDYLEAGSLDESCYRSDAVLVDVLVYGERIAGCTALYVCDQIGGEVLRDLDEKMSTSADGFCDFAHHQKRMGDMLQHMRELDIVVGLEVSGSGDTRHSGFGGDIRDLIDELTAVKGGKIFSIGAAIIEHRRTGEVEVAADPSGQCGYAL